MASDAAVDALRIASTTPAKLRREKVAAVEAVCSHACQTGLARHQLKSIVAILARRSLLDQASSTTLVRNLYPAERVQPDIIVTIVAGFGQGQNKPSAATQTALLKWILAVLDLLEDATVLSKLYGVLFNLLDTMSVRTPLCHLLSLITRRKHVRPFRIQQLLEMVRATGQDPALVGLLRVYKDYYPDIIIGTAATGRVSLPSPSQDEWRQRLHAIQEANADRVEQLQTSHNGFKVIRRGVKRTKASILPDVRTSHAHESSVTLEEIDGADNLVEYLDRIELPNQLLASFKDPLLQKYLILNPSDAAARRTELWLESFLRDALDAAADGTGPSDHLAELLEGMLNYTRSTKVMLRTSQEFLKSYIPLWDGLTNSEFILGLLAYSPVQDFADFRDSHLRPAEAAVVSSGSADAYERLLDFYAQLIHNWNRTANSSSSTPSPDSSTTPAESFTALTTHISTSILSFLSSTRLSTLTATTILHFYSTLATLSSPSTPLIIPPAPTLYNLLFHPSLATLSHTCTLLASYKRAFEADMHSTSLPRHTTNTFNGYLMDVANLLWRSRALSPHDPNALACLCAPPLAAALNAHVATLPPLLAADASSPVAGTGPDYTLAALFGLPLNPLTTAAAAAAFRRREDAAAAVADADADADADAAPLPARHAPGPVTQRSLHRLGRAGGVDLSWKAYRVEVLRWLEERGVPGLRELMFVTMKDLMKEVVA